MGLVLVSYLCTVGEVGAAAGETIVGSAGLAGAGDTNDNRVAWRGEEGLARGLDEEPWLPLVFAMSGMCEGFRRGGRFSQGRMIFAGRAMGLFKEDEGCEGLGEMEDKT